MKQVLDRTRDVFGHDIDNVHTDERLYTHTPYGDVYRFFGAAKIPTARTFVPELTGSDEDILAIGKQSYLTTGDGLKAYVDFAVASGMKEYDLRIKMHQMLHKIAFRNAVEAVPHMFEPCAKTNAAFDALRGHVRHGYLTMGCATYWASPLLEKRERLKYFEPDLRFGFSEVGFINKRNSTRPLEIFLQHAGIGPERLVFPEDTLPNLEKAKELDDRILTVWVDQAQSDLKTPDYVDMRVASITELLEAAVAVHAAPRPKNTSPHLGMS